MCVCEKITGSMVTLLANGAYYRRHANKICLISEKKSYIQYKYYHTVRILSFVTRRTAKRRTRYKQCCISYSTLLYFIQYYIIHIICYLFLNDDDSKHVYITCYLYSYFSSQSQR